MAMATVIRNAAWVVAWDEASGRHHYLRDVDVAFTALLDAARTAYRGEVPDSEIARLLNDAFRHAARGDAA